MWHNYLLLPFPPTGKPGPPAKGAPRAPAGKALAKGAAGAAKVRNQIVDREPSLALLEHSFWDASQTIKLMHQQFDFWVYTHS